MGPGELSINIVFNIWPLSRWVRLRVENTVCDYAIIVGPIMILIEKP